MARKSYKNSKRSKRSKRRSIKRSIKKRSKISSLKDFCRGKLSNKIKINMKEYKKGNKRIKSHIQAIAISYSQVKKKYPKCSRSLRRKSKK
jgi:hypothetical protein